MTTENDFGAHCATAARSSRGDQMKPREKPCALCGQPFVDTSKFNHRKTCCEAHRKTWIAKNRSRVEPARKDWKGYCPCGNKANGKKDGSYCCSECARKEHKLALLYNNDRRAVESVPIYWPLA